MLNYLNISSVQMFSSKVQKTEIDFSASGFQQNKTYIYIHLEQHYLNYKKKSTYIVLFAIKKESVFGF